MSGHTMCQGSLLTPLPGVKQAELRVLASELGGWAGEAVVLGVRLVSCQHKATLVEQPPCPPHTEAPPVSHGLADSAPGRLVRLGIPPHPCLALLWEGPEVMGRCTDPCCSWRDPEYEEGRGRGRLARVEGGPQGPGLPWCSSGANPEPAPPGQEGL